jgi:hypothetical protein
MNAAERNCFMQNLAIKVNKPIYSMINHVMVELKPTSERGSHDEHRASHLYFGFFKS